MTDTNEDINFKKAKRIAFDEVAAAMGKHLETYVNTLNAATVQKNTTSLWRTIARCIERGVAYGVEMEERAKRDMNGHGKSNLKAYKIQTNMDRREK